MPCLILVRRPGPYSSCIVMGLLASTLPWSIQSCRRPRLSGSSGIAWLGGELPNIGSAVRVSQILA